MEQAKLKFGIIGCGGMAQGHIGQLGMMPESSVVALADTSPQSIANTRARHVFARDIPAFANYQDMLKQVPLDAVVIVTPHALHFAPAADALSAGLHVLIEKPFVPTVEQAQTLMTKAAEAGKLLGVAYQRHSQGQFRYMKDVVASGKIGQIQFASVFLSQNWYNGTRGTWRQDPKLSCGGEMNDSGSHMLDMFLWLVDQKVTEVAAQVDNFDTGVDINSALLVRFANGAIGNVAVIGHATQWHEDLQFFGSKGSLQYLNGKVYERLFDSPYVAEVISFGPSVQVVKNFVDAILGREPLNAPADVALKVIALTSAAFESARTGRPTKL